MIGRKGIIVGGTIRATKKITAKNIGTPMGIDTILEVGSDPNTIDRFHELKKNISELRKDMAKIVPTITSYQGKMAEGEHLRPDVIFRLKELSKLFREKKIEYDKLQQEFQIIEMDFMESGNGVIIVNGTAYPGVKMMISDAGYTVRDEKHNCKFYKEEAEVKVITIF